VTAKVRSFSELPNFFGSFFPFFFPDRRRGEQSVSLSLSKAGAKVVL